MLPKDKKSTSIKGNGVKSGRVKKSISRKQRRKLERTAKKQRNAVHSFKGKCSGAKGTLTAPADSQERSVNRSSTRQTVSHVGTRQAKSPRSLSNFRKQALAISNKREDVEISKLEKLLKIKKRKNLPSSFRDEGLDCILFCCVCVCMCVCVWGGGGLGQGEDYWCIVRRLFLDGL